jgi:hypothetical protein
MASATWDQLLWSGMLLSAYAFWQLGQIALCAAIVSFTAAGAPHLTGKDPAR